MERRIVAMGGGGFLAEPDNPLLDEYVLSLARAKRPRICFVPTASGDAEGTVARFYRSFSALDCRPTDLGLFVREKRDLRAFVLARTSCTSVAATRRTCSPSGAPTGWTRSWPTPGARVSCSAA